MFLPATYTESLRYMVYDQDLFPTYYQMHSCHIILQVLIVFHRHRKVSSVPNQNRLLFYRHLAVHLSFLTGTVQVSSAYPGAKAKHLYFYGGVKLKFSINGNVT